jgi:hypothetical protein
MWRARLQKVFSACFVGGISRCNTWRFGAYDVFKACSQFWEKRLLPSSCLPVCLPARIEQIGSHWTDFDEICYLNFFFFLAKILTKLTGTFGEDVCTFMIISRRILLKRRNGLDKSCRENQNTHFVFSNFFFFFSENPAVCETMWKNMVEPERSQLTVRRMCVSCWITKATHTPNI